MLFLVSRIELKLAMEFQSFNGKNAGRLFPPDISGGFFSKELSFFFSRRIRVASFFQSALLCCSFLRQAALNMNYAEQLSFFFFFSFFL